MKKIIKDQKYGFPTAFNTETGEYVRAFDLTYKRKCHNTVWGHAELQRHNLYLQQPLKHSDSPAKKVGEFFILIIFNYSSMLSR